VSVAVRGSADWRGVRLLVVGMGLLAVQIRLTRERVWLMC
jgi:hypothetical protein